MRFASVYFHNVNYSVGFVFVQKKTAIARTEEVNPITAKVFNCNFHHLKLCLAEAIHSITLSELKLFTHFL